VVVGLSTPDLVAAPSASRPLAAALAVLVLLAATAGTAAQAVIPQHVEHQRDQVAGGGDHAGVVAAALCDQVEPTPQPWS